MNHPIRMLLAAIVTTLLASTARGQDSFGQAGQQPQPQPQPGQYPQSQQYPQQQYPQPQGSQQQYPQQAPQQQYPQQQYPQQQGGPYGQQAPQGGMAPPAQGGWGQPQQTPSAQGGADLGQLTQLERQDLGVAPTAQLHSGAMHGPTPASIPGGQLITTQGLVELVKSQQVRALVFDVLGGPETIPGAIAAVPAHQAGSFNDQTQQQFGAFLQQSTQGRKDTPLVFYCQSTQCWMSYNAALRAINLGYTNVLWYRGGIEAWKMGGQPVQRQQAGYGP
jgi:PQQ-dependent catabolism-associated CXXCW motif protein